MKGKIDAKKWFYLIEACVGTAILVHASISAGAHAAIRGLNRNPYIKMINSDGVEVKIRE